MQGGVFHENPKDIVSSLRFPSSKNPLLEEGEIYPLFYDSNIKTLNLLKLLIEEIRPAIVIETGVANGASTRQILSTFKEFNLINSKLYSLDVNPKVATPDLLSNAQFNFIPIHDPNSFTLAMDRIGSVDLFYHDSDHSYKNQMLEYETAWEMLNPVKGILVSDDINWSNAFLDFSKKVNLSPLLLSGGGKFTGVISKGMHF
jgi:predicted O-methyltransferase YrrM